METRGAYQRAVGGSVRIWSGMEPASRIMWKAQAKEENRRIKVEKEELDRAVSEDTRTGLFGIVRKSPPVRVKALSDPP